MYQNVSNIHNDIEFVYYRNRRQSTNVTFDALWSNLLFSKYISYSVYYKPGHPIDNTQNVFLFCLLWTKTRHTRYVYKQSSCLYNVYRIYTVLCDLGLYNTYITILMNCLKNHRCIIHVSTNDCHYLYDILNPWHRWIKV